MKQSIRPAIFKWRQTEPELILCAVRWYLRYSFSFRDVEERRCCMNTRCGWGGVARTSRDPPQEPHYGDEVEGSSHV